MKRRMKNKINKKVKDSNSFLYLYKDKFPYIYKDLGKYACGYDCKYIHRGEEKYVCEKGCIYNCIMRNKKVIKDKETKNYAIDQ